MMAARGVPRQAGIVAGHCPAVMAGLLVIGGLWTGLAASLTLFLIVATPMFHNFWDHQGRIAPHA
ncbi:hypothetical protein [Mesorhizobium sp. WSM3873]|uniref:hypothetical protein n=1 Tax=Mesorhizobium sp. WSM3873 TaxID=1854056 RepID=UPI000A5BCFB4